VPLKRFAEYYYPVLACCLYEIKIPKNIPVLYVSPVSHFVNEYEVLIPSNSHMHSSDKLFVKRIYGYEDRVIVSEMEVTGIKGTKSVRKTRKMLLRGMSKRRRQSKRSVKKSRRSVKPKPKRKPLGGAGGPAPSSNNQGWAK
jgi:hypothetical protein